MKNKIIVLTSLTGAIAISNAAVVNGGFETGNLSGWTQNSGIFNGGNSFSYTGSYNSETVVVGAGFDPVVQAAGGTLQRVYNGNYSVRVNDIAGGYHFNTLAQNWTVSDSSFNFEWAAVLQEPGHDHDHEPSFTINLVDLTTAVTLYSVFYASDTLPSGTFYTGSYAGETLKWTDWFTESIDTSALTGHNLSLTLLVSDCGYGGHGGYVYLDAFANSILPPNPGVPVANPAPQTISVPEPSSAVLFGLASLGLAVRRRRH